MKHILFICGKSSTVINFRKELILFLLSKNIKISLIISDDERIEEIKQLGVGIFVVEFDNRSKSFFSTLKTRKQIHNIIKTLLPDMVFTFQAKPNILGAMAAKKAKIKHIFSMIEGLGDPFQPQTKKEKIFMLFYIFIYRLALKKVECVFFLNEDDKNIFLKNNITTTHNSYLIDGIGIDTTEFAYQKIKDTQTILMISRLIKNKGILDFCNAAKLAKAQNPNLKFKLIGGELQLTLNDIKRFIDEGIIEYYGEVKDVKPFISNSTFVTLPSYYREGLPRSILEAMSMGRPIIGYNSVGIKDIVVNEVTGYLVKAHDIEGLSKIYVNCFNDFKIVETMSLNSRKRIEEKYSSDIINNLIYKFIARKLPNND